MFRSVSICSRDCNISARAGVRWEEEADFGASRSQRLACSTSSPRNFLLFERGGFDRFHLRGFDASADADHPRDGSFGL